MNPAGQSAPKTSERRVVKPPLSGPGGVPAGADHGGADRHEPVDVPGRTPPQPEPHEASARTRRPGPTSEKKRTHSVAPRTVPLRHIPPNGPGPEPPHDPVEHHTDIQPPETQPPRNPAPPGPPRRTTAQHPRNEATT